eukprot:scaffold5119_cov78-Cylindrotheca_fusiformis.AAC.1
MSLILDEHVPQHLFPSIPHTLFNLTDTSVFKQQNKPPAKGRKMVILSPTTAQVALRDTPSNDI